MKTQGPDWVDVISYFLVLALFTFAAVGVGCIIDWILL